MGGFGKGEEPGALAWTPEEEDRGYSVQNHCTVQANMTYLLLYWKKFKPLQSFLPSAVFSALMIFIVDHLTKLKAGHRWMESQPVQQGPAEIRSIYWQVECTSIHCSTLVQPACQNFYHAISLAGRTQ